MQYALDRLDVIITGELNPQHDHIIGIKAFDAASLLEKVRTETILIRKFLWDMLQELPGKEQLKIIALQYRSSIDYLLEEVRLYQSSVRSHGSKDLKKLYTDVEHCLDDVFSFVQRHFSVWIIPEIKSGDVFLHTSLNEQELTILLCAFIDAGIISNHTYTSFLELAAPVLATKRKKGLTAASMLKSKDKLTADMKKKIKDLLLGMAREVERY